MTSRVEVLSELSRVSIGLLLGGLGIAALLFWVLALVDCTRRDFAQPNDKTMWVLIIVLTSWIGALIYWFVGRPKGTLA